MYLLKLLGYCLIPGQKVAHTPRHKSSQSMSLLGCGSSASEKVCFWCPLKYSNCEILGNFIWSCSSSRDSWALGSVGHLLSSGVDSVKEGESLLLMSLGFHLICHNVTPSILAKQDACLQSMYQEMFLNQGCKVGGLNCGLKEGASLEKA